MSKCNPIDTPASPDARLIPMKEGEEKVDIHQYQSAIGSLIYLSTKTRPDISFAVHQVSRHCHNPSRTHWTAVKRIIRYLKGTLNYGILYKHSSTDNLKGYSDSDFASDTSDRKSVSGNIFMMQGGPVSWLSRKQTTVSMSTAEAEYVALSTCAQEAIYG